MDLDVLGHRLGDDKGAAVQKSNPGQAKQYWHQVIKIVPSSSPSYARAYQLLNAGGGAPGELPALHAAAAGWYADHGYPVEAVRHAEAAQDWVLAARVLSRVGPAGGTHS